jgi:hypothetical protein
VSVCVCVCVCVVFCLSCSLSSSSLCSLFGRLVLSVWPLGLLSRPLVPSFCFVVFCLSSPVPQIPQGSAAGGHAATPILLCPSSCIPCIFLALTIPCNGQWVCPCPAQIIPWNGQWVPSTDYALQWSVGLLHFLFCLPGNAPDAPML